MNWSLSKMKKERGWRTGGEEMIFKGKNLSTGDR